METVSPVSQSTLAKRPPTGSACYSLVEIAGLLNIGYTTAHEGALAGTLPVHGFRVGRQWRFPKAAVDRLLGIDHAGTADTAGDA